MSRHREPTDKKCNKCGGEMQHVSEKNPFIDDFADDCLNGTCPEFMSGSDFLSSSSRSAARAEREMDRFERSQCDDEEG